MYKYVNNQVFPVNDFMSSYMNLNMNKYSTSQMIQNDNITVKSKSNYVPFSSQQKSARYIKRMPKNIELPSSLPLELSVSSNESPDNKYVDEMNNLLMGGKRIQLKSQQADS